MSGLRGLRGLGEKKGLEEVRGIGEEKERAQAVSFPEIAVRPRLPGAGGTEDPLEKAAMQGIVGTLPERIVYKWLMIQEIVFETQVVEGSDRASLGSAVLDFYIVGVADQPIALRVQGEWWHSGPVRSRYDDEQAERLRGQGYYVADVWEGALYEAVLGGWLDEFLWDVLQTAG